MTGCCFQSIRLWREQMKKWMYHIEWMHMYDTSTLAWTIKNHRKYIFVIHEESSEKQQNLFHFINIPMFIFIMFEIFVFACNCFVYFCIIFMCCLFLFLYYSHGILFFRGWEEKVKLKLLHPKYSYWKRSYLSFLFKSCVTLNYSLANGMNLPLFRNLTEMPPT